MTLSEEFWQQYKINDQDLEDIYNYLLETETPLDKFEITRFIVEKEIARQDQLQISADNASGQRFLPEKTYVVGDSLIFPALDNSTGDVTTVRQGNNPDFPDLQVIDVAMSTGKMLSFASNLKDHKLNNPPPPVKEKLLDSNYVIGKFGPSLAEKIVDACSRSNDLVCIAKHYFPRALLFDIGIGHLNLCEAVLEMIGGGPLSTIELIKQIELPTGDNEKLTEFSMDYALEVDGRFDEVGPAGITLWFLKRLEPIEVQKPPLTLQFHGSTTDLSQDLPGLTELNRLVEDELEVDSSLEVSDEVMISISYPHWRAGTLPLTSRVKSIFPTAFETPRVKFLFKDGSDQENFAGWVVRPSKYIYGLKNWYEKQGVIPGSYVTIRRSKNPEEVIVQTTKNKNSRDWIRTVLVGTDGGIVFALLKQVIKCTFDDRMAIMITDVDGIDRIWSNPSRSRQPNDKVVLTIMREIGKLNTQNQIHAQELYSAVNVVKRIPPSQILLVLYSEPWAKHLGDLYFKLEESS